MRYLIFIFFALVSLSASASPLDKMFKDFAANTNYTKPGAFQDQAAGHYTGGGFAMRNGNQALRPIRISLPHLGASCRGIDAYFGAFSFVKGEELIRMLRNMGSSAASYAFQLGLKTMAPSVETLLSQLRKIALDANKMALDDCHMVQQMFAASLPKGSAALEQACIDVKSQGSTGDWFGARQNCQANDAAKEEAIQDYKEKAPDLMMGEYNLTWHALMKVESFKSDHKLAEFVMSVVGTLVSRKESEKYRVHTIQGKGDSGEFIQAHMKGRPTKILVCDDHSKCLNPTWVDVTIGEKGIEKSLFERVREYVRSISLKYLSRTELSDDEKNFLSDGQKTPIYKYIQVALAEGTNFIMEDAVEYIALSILLEQFETFASHVLHYLDELQSIQLEDSHIQAFKKNVQDLRLRIQQIQTRADNGSAYRLLKMIQTYERKINSEKGG